MALEQINEGSSPFTSCRDSGIFSSFALHASFKNSFKPIQKKKASKK